MRNAEPCVSSCNNTQQSERQGIARPFAAPQTTLMRSNEVRYHMFLLSRGTEIALSARVSHDERNSKYSVVGGLRPS